MGLLRSDGFGLVEVGVMSGWRGGVHRTASEDRIRSGQMGWDGDGYGVGWGAVRAQDVRPLLKFEHKRLEAVGQLSHRKRSNGLPRATRGDGHSTGRDVHTILIILRDKGGVFVCVVVVGLGWGAAS